jgi:DNA modification methylase
LRAVDWDFRDSETDSLTHGLHPYPAKFIPQIPHTLIHELSKPGDTVADVFCGSGTTLVEALVQGRHSIGVDASELACVISRAKTARLTTDELKELRELESGAEQLATSFDRVQASLFSCKVPVIDGDTLVAEAIRFWFEPHVIRELAAIRDLFSKLSDRSRSVAQTCFASIVVTVSKQDSDTRYVRRDKDIPPADPTRRFLRALREAIAALQKLSAVVAPELICKVIHADVLDAPDIGSVDLVVSSPPYPNAYSYHLYHMTRMLWLGMDQATFKLHEIGSHRKYSSNGRNRANAYTFRRELTSVFSWLQRHLKKKGYVCFVIGNSIIRGELIENGQLAVDAAVSLGFRLIARMVRTLKETKKSFNPKIGKIKQEQIIILRLDD